LKAQLVDYESAVERLERQRQELNQRVFSARADVQSLSAKVNELRGLISQSKSKQASMKGSAERLKFEEQLRSFASLLEEASLEGRELKHQQNILKEASSNEVQ